MPFPAAYSELGNATDLFFMYIAQQPLLCSVFIDHAVAWNRKMSSTLHKDWYDDSSVLTMQTCVLEEGTSRGHFALTLIFLLP